MRVLIVAADASAAEAVRRVLRYAPGCQVLGWVDARQPCGRLRGDVAADVVVLDDAAGMATLLGRLPEVRTMHPRAKIVLLARDVEAALLSTAVSAGVDAVLSKSIPGPAIGTLVREIAAERIFHFAPARVDAAPLPVGAQALTSRELQILRLVTGGLSNSGIAAELWVTEQTVKFHLSNVYRKLGLANRTQAAHYAHVHGLVASPDAYAPSSVSVAA